MDSIIKTPSTRVNRAERGLRVAVVIVAVMVAWFYYWTVQSAAADLNLRGQKRDYYNLLIDGFEDGHMYMKEDPDPRLLALPPAERPGGAPFKLDASLFNGHYYLYFGVTPVMVLMMPYAVLTGHDFPEALAAVIVMLAGFGFATAWWWEVRRQFFPRLGGFWVVLGVVALGLCTAAPSALRRPLFYEVAIGAGYAFSMMALWAATRAWQRPRQALWWLVVAGISVGLAVGSRANLAPAGLLLLCATALGLAWREPARFGRRRIFVTALVAAGVGASAVGAGLATYNYARFGSIAEFGHHHQLGTNPKQMFRLENLKYNLALYYLKPPSVNGYFPYFAPAEEGAKPSDYVGREQVHGQWPWTLVVVLAALASIAAEERRDQNIRRWLGVWALAVLLFTVNALVVAMTGVRSNRYMVDFHPALVLATLVAVSARLEGRGVWKRLLGFGFGALVLLAAIFNVLGSLQVHDFFRSTDPITYTRLSAWADGVVWPWLRGEAAAVGDCSVEVQWPTGNRGARREPFFATGTNDFRDVIFIDFDGVGRSRFVYQHGEFGDLAGDWFKVTPGAKVTVKLGGALLLPGVVHPWYGGRSKEERQALKRRLWVSVDDQLYFNRDVLSFDSSPRLHRWGLAREIDGNLSMFTGQMHQITFRPVNDTGLSSREEKRGAIRLKLFLPTDRYGWVEPLLQQSGAKGFDVLAIQYLRPGFVRLLHDQLGGGGRWSEEFAVDYSQPQWIEFNLPESTDEVPWDSNTEELVKLKPKFLTATWNDRVVFRPNLPLLPAAAKNVALGVNWWNASGMRVFFAGRLEELPRLQNLGVLTSGFLKCRFNWGEPSALGHGVWLRLERADGNVASLVWQKVKDSSFFRLGWLEDGRLSWFASMEKSDLERIQARLQITAASAALRAPSPTWIELEVPNKGVYAHKTTFFNNQTITAWGLDKQAWQGSALGLTDPWDAKPAIELPGRVRLRFQLPAGGLVGSDPLVSAGRPGAADSIFLRGDAKGRYVVGLDHWGLGATESAPVALASDQVHTLVVEMASLGKPGELPSGRVRLLLDGQVVLDVAQALYPVDPKEIVFGLNPHGMSTSNAVFRGEIVSVRAQAAADDTR
jgi:hypothetical protein